LSTIQFCFHVYCKCKVVLHQNKRSLYFAQKYVTTHQQMRFDALDSMWWEDSKMQREDEQQPELQHTDGSDHRGAMTCDALHGTHQGAQCRHSTCSVQSSSGLKVAQQICPCAQLKS